MRVRKTTAVLLSLAMSITMVVAMPSVASADQSSVIDFEGLAEGSIVSSVSAGSGISGDDAGGSVGVLGTNPVLPGNAAMIFDAECDGAQASCTGQDPDLYFPGNGNTLIITEDFDGADPDDADLVGATWDFDFSTWGPGVVQVDSIQFGDIEGEEPNVTVDLYSGGLGGTLEATFDFGPTGDNVLGTLSVGTSGVDSMRVTINGSGTMDNIEITVLEETASARVTGGGHQITVIDDSGDRVRITRGFTLHCDITLSNNLEINWPGGNKWHIDKLVDDAYCEDNPDFAPDPPKAGADTYVGIDLGTLNNTQAAWACWIFEDHGEPGSSDRALIHIFQPGHDPGIDVSGDDPCGTEFGPNSLVFVALQEITGGNIQFHEDQPHK